MFLHNFYLSLGRVTFYIILLLTNVVTTLKSFEVEFVRIYIYIYMYVIFRGSNPVNSKIMLEALNRTNDL